MEQVKRLTDLKLKDMSSIAQTTEVATNEQFFINTLEDRLKHRESRLKELELENDNYLREIKELYDNLMDVEKQREECKEQIKENELRMSRMRQECKHNEKKVKNKIEIPSQYVHNVFLTFIRRRPNVMDVI